ncbi:DUF1214 domain-containing protein [Vibrio sp. FNV 38]|nr:DUF1214 domain-containing protein [Vibrio sp. FNV 38]
MKRTLIALALSSTLLAPFAVSAFDVTPEQSVRVEQATVALKNQDERALAQLAYEYAYSIDEAYKYFYETAVKPNYPLNQFQNIRKLADDTYTAHPTINNDTLHLMGWMDVSSEPVIITVPDHDEGRYWLFHTMNLEHFTDSAFGSPQRGTEGGIFMYALEGWEGHIPASVDQVIYVEHPLVKMMGRIMDLGGDDSAKALELMDHWSIRTLSAMLGEKGPEQAIRDYPNPETTHWVERVNFVLSEGTMRLHDQSLLNDFGLVKLGAPFGVEFTEHEIALIEQAEKDGLKHIMNAGFDDSRDILGTREEMTAVPSFQHAYGTAIGQWGLPAAYTMYQAEYVDADGEPLNGEKYDYSVTFEAPDIDKGGFWSYTAYSAETKLMEHNAMNRHSRGDRTLTPNADGTYTIYMSSETQGYEDNVNFLPIPDHNWYGVLRMYSPGERVRSDEWKSTPFSKVEK